jgi:hypothetical protein
MEPLVVRLGICSIAQQQQQQQRQP